MIEETQQFAGFLVFILARLYNTELTLTKFLNTFMGHILDSTKYHFTVDEEQEGDSYVIVSKLFFGEKIKEFRTVGKSSVERMTKHMASLTESQCDQWMKNLK